MNKKTKTVGDQKDSWPEDYFSLFGALDEGDLVEPREIPIIRMNWRFNT